MPGTGEQPNDTWAAYLSAATSSPGWSVARLARESGIHRATIYKWIDGTAGNLTLSSVRAIADALGDPTGAANAVRGLLLDEEPDDDADTARAMSTLLRRLRDPRTTPAQKAMIKGALTELAALPESAPSEADRADTA